MDADDRLYLAIVDLGDALHIASAEMDCGDGSCPFKGSSGMRTNGGCSLGEAPLSRRQRMAMTRLAQAARAVVEASRSREAAR